jgi:hypothetical protein
MPIECIKPTINLNQPVCRFSPDEIPPCDRGETITTAKKLNWLNRTVTKINNAESKGAKMAKGLARICLIISLIGLPIVLLWDRHIKILKKDVKLRTTTQDAVNLPFQQWNKRAEMIQNCGIFNLETLPILDLGDRSGATDYIDFIKPENLTAPVMKGLDIHKRPFISLKIKRKDHDEVFVTTIFQRYTDHTRWNEVSSQTVAGLNHPLNPDRVPNKSFTPFEIVGSFSATEQEICARIINGEHPIFTLAS